MKIIIIPIVLFVFVFTACGNNSDTKPIEWGDIVSFSMNWGGFHEGYWNYKIVKTDDVYILNANGFNDVRMFVPESQPINFNEMEILRHILEENDMDRWNGYIRPWDGSTSDPWGFDLAFELDTGSTFKMSVSDYLPEGFREVFQILLNALFDLEERYTLEPEWGNLDRVSFEIRAIGRQDLSVHYSIVLRDGSAYFTRRPGLNDIEFPAETMLELHQLMIEHGIDQWWWDEYRRNIFRNRPQPQRQGHWTQISVGFDNGTGFLNTRSTTRECEAIDALLTFFEELESNVQQSQ